MNVVMNGRALGTVVMPQPQVVTVEKPRIQVVQIGMQGPQGPQGVQGIPGPAGAVTQTLLAGEALGGHRFVVPDASGAAVYASSAEPTHVNKVLGMTVGAAVLGAEVQIQSIGEHLEPSWSWALGQPIYLGASGLLTQTPPTTGFSLIVAFPITATKIFIVRREPIVLN